MWHEIAIFIYQILLDSNISDFANFRHQMLLHPFDTENLITPFTEEVLLPQDWVFLPLIELYNKFCSV